MIPAKSPPAPLRSKPSVRDVSLTPHPKLCLFARIRCSLGPEFLLTFLLCLLLAPLGPSAALLAMRSGFISWVFALLPICRRLLLRPSTEAMVLLWGTPQVPTWHAVGEVKQLRGTRVSGSLCGTSHCISLCLGFFRVLWMRLRAGSTSVSLTYSKLSRDSALRTLAPTLPSSPGPTTPVPSSSLNTIKGLAPKSLTHIHSNPLFSQREKWDPKVDY